MDGSKRSKPTASADPADLGSLDFGELTAKRGGARGIDDEMRRRARQRRKSGDLGTLLERAKANQSKLAELQGTKEGAKMEHDQKWDAAARRAAGEKVKDDPKLLAKALKRKERSKAKSAEAWAERKATSDQQQAARQARREANLQRQIDHKKGIKAPKGKVGRKGGPAGAAAAGGKRPGSGSTKKVRDNHRTISDDFVCLPRLISVLARCSTSLRAVRFVFCVCVRVYVCACACALCACKPPTYRFPARGVTASARSRLRV